MGRWAGGALPSLPGSGLVSCDSCQFKRDQTLHKKPLSAPLQPASCTLLGFCSPWRAALYFQAGFMEIGPGVVWKCCTLRLSAPLEGEKKKVWKIKYFCQKHDKSFAVWEGEKLKLQSRERASVRGGAGWGSWLQRGCARESAGRRS